MQVKKKRNWNMCIEGSLLKFKMAPLDSGSSTKSPLKILILENLCGLILNLGTCIITIDTILQKFAFPCATRYADFIGLSGEPNLKR